MRKLTCLFLSLSITLILPGAAAGMGYQAKKRLSKGVPAEYTGAWVCQTGVPGQTMIHSTVNIISGTYESTTTTTTPGVVAMKFNLNANGTYNAPNASGHYSFDAATKAITWLDGLHHEKITKTQIEERNGAPSMHFEMLQRYWGCFKPGKGSDATSPEAVSTEKVAARKTGENTPAVVLPNPGAAAYAAPIVTRDVAQLATQAAAIRLHGVPELAQLAQLTIASRAGQPPQNVLSEPSEDEVPTRFLRSTTWHQPWAWANDISKKIPWDDPSAPAGSGFARQQSGSQMLTKLFTAALEYYERQALVEGYPTNDLAVTYTHCIAVNMEISTGRKLTAQDELQLRQSLRNKMAHYPYYFPDGSKQSAHENMVITTVLTQAGYAEATLNRDERAQILFRETARRNLETLKNASIDDLLKAGWGPGK